MKAVVVLLAAAALLAGCGQASAPKDRFVGTWQAVGRPDINVVITKHRGAYRAAWDEGGSQMPPVVLHRDPGGDSLYSGKGDDPTGQLVFELTNTGASLAEPNGYIWDMFSISDSTADPTPSP
jgi:hypothetical protein